MYTVDCIYIKNIWDWTI